MYRLIILLFLFVGISWSFNAHAQTSAAQQVDRSLKLIAAKDGIYNAVLAINPGAKEDAIELDNSESSMLQGMPILVKDNIDVLGMPTTAGSLALTNNFPREDAPSISQLKKSGAVILGKANLSEWANFRSEKSSSGWSGVGGQTLNAFDQTRTPCGSSSGSGVAVALGYVDVAIGTETHGSIICPATINGVVGFKPTHGIVSGNGIVPLASSQDTAGPLANSIENAALVLSAMIDPNTKNYAELSNGLRKLDSAPQLKGLRIGVLASTQGFDVRRDKILDRAIEKLKLAGVNIVEQVRLETADGFWDDNFQLLKYEFKRDLNKYFADRQYADKNNPLKTMTLEKLIAFNKENADKELKYFDQSIFEQSQTLELSEIKYREILSKGHIGTREEGLDKVFSEKNLDAIIGISAGAAWKIDYINGDSFFGPGMSGFPAVGGHPHVTVPGGKISGMPIGISFIGERYQDHTLAQIIYRFMDLLFEVILGPKSGP